MKRWGLIIALVYVVIVLAVLAPATLLLIRSYTPTLADFREAYQSSILWIITAVIILGEFVLLWLSVDTSERRLRPRTRVVISAITSGLFLMIMTVVIVLAFTLALWGEKAIPDLSTLAGVVSAFLLPWLVWGVLFYRVCQNSTDPVTRAVSWLFRGSVLELLIAVPAHVIVRRRHDCCAPIVTGFGITSGIAIMLLSFGPSVLLLYKKRMEQHAARTPTGKQI